jgi:hypothetical protein
MEWVRGGVLREWWSGELPRLIGRYPAAPADLTTACEVEAVCSGEAGRLLRRLGAGAAAAAVMQEAPADDTVAERISAVERGLMKFAQRAVTPEAVRREFGHRHLEWIRIDCRALGFAERVQAEEAAYCVREDGLSFDAVAVDAHTGVYEERFYVEDLDPEHRVLFTSAVPFELIGPIEVDGRHTIFRIMDKVMPSEQDHELTARARNAVLARALEAEAQSRVTWRWEP